MRESLISCNSFVRSIFVCLNFNYFFYNILDCILVRVYCTEHVPIHLNLAEKICFTIVKIEICQQNYSTKRNLMNKLGNLGF